MCQGYMRPLTHKHSWRTATCKPNETPELCCVDTEAGMLSGISRKRSIRSDFYWFTEFCNSQCLSHFAAPFIVVRAETSVAESFEEIGERTKRSRGGTWEREVQERARQQERSISPQSDFTPPPASFCQGHRRNLHPRTDPHT